MKLKKTALALIIAGSVLAGTIIGVSGAETFQRISAELRSDFTVKYNGEEQILKDANGDRVYPITYNGSTYVPFRALGNMLGLEVGWDADTKTVMYDTPSAPKPKGLDLIDKCTKKTSNYATVVTSSKNQKIKVGEDTVDHWIRMEVARNASRYVTYNLGEEFKTLTLRAYSSYDTLVTVYNNETKDSVLGTFTVKGGEAPADHTVSVSNSLQIRIEIIPDRYADGEPTKDDYLYLYNAYLT